MQTTLSYPVSLARIQVIADATVHERSPAWVRLLGLAMSAPLDVHALKRVTPELSTAARGLVIQSLASAGLLTASGTLTDAGRAALTSGLVPRSEVGCFEVLIASGPGLPPSGIPCFVRRTPEIEGIRLERLREVTSTVGGLPRVLGVALPTAGGGQLRLDRLYEDPSGHTAVRRPPVPRELSARRLRVLDFATGRNSHVIELSGLVPGASAGPTIELEPLSQQDVQSLLGHATYQAKQPSAPGQNSIPGTWDAELARLGTSAPPPGVSHKGPFAISVDVTCHIPGEVSPNRFTLNAVPVGPISRDRASQDAWFTKLLSNAIPQTPVVPREDDIAAIENKLIDAILPDTDASPRARAARIARWREGTTDQRHLAFRLGIVADFDAVAGLSA